MALAIWSTISCFVMYSICLRRTSGSWTLVNMRSTSASRALRSSNLWDQSSISMAQIGDRSLFLSNTKSTDLPLICEKAPCQFCPFTLWSRSLDRCTWGIT